jgi:hypothetical protein
MLGSIFSYTLKLQDAQSKNLSILYNILDV